jgi:hypothetical protein
VVRLCDVGYIKRGVCGQGSGERSPKGDARGASPHYEVSGESGNVQVVC